MYFQPPNRDTITLEELKDYVLNSIEVSVLELTTWVDLIGLLALSRYKKGDTKFDVTWKLATINIAIKDGNKTQDELRMMVADLAKLMGMD